MKTRGGNCLENSCRKRAGRCSALSLFPFRAKALVSLWLGDYWNHNEYFIPVLLTVFREKVPNTRIVRTQLLRVSQLSSSWGLALSRGSCLSPVRCPSLGPPASKSWSLRARSPGLREEQLGGAFPAQSLLPDGSAEVSVDTRHPSSASSSAQSLLPQVYVDPEHLVHYSSCTWFFSGSLFLRGPQTEIAIEGLPSEGKHLRWHGVLLPTRNTHYLQSAK